MKNIIIEKVYFKSKRQEKDYNFIYNLIYFNELKVRQAFNSDIIISLEEQEHNLFLRYAKSHNLKIVRNVYIINKNITYVIAKKSFVIS